MKTIRLVALVSLMVAAVAMTGHAQGNEGAVTLDHVVGLVNGQIPVDAQVSFYLRFNNNTGTALYGMANGFRLYSPTGASWTTTTAQVVGAMPLGANVTILTAEATDGLSPDTVGFFASGGLPGQDPLPVGYNSVVLKITIGPIDNSHAGGTICLDSAWFPYSNYWEWSSSGESLRPTWDGPHCWTIYSSTPLDSDQDGVPNIDDNCPFYYNPGQQDWDEDGLGDPCDDCTDFDDDGYGDPYYAAYNTCPDDNCPSVANPSQLDSDSDGKGDACDNCTDSDNDGFGDPGYAGNTCAVDNCPDQANPDQTDTDSDGIGNACDNCPVHANADQADTDNDLVGNACDNCPYNHNPTQVDSDGDGIGDACDSPTDVWEADATLPLDFALGQNYPNPFNPDTRIEFALPEAGMVRLDIYSISGARIRSLVNEPMAAGHKTATWDGRDDSGAPVASGVYLYRLECGGHSASRKMVLMK